MPLVRRGPGIVGAAARTAVVAGTATAVSGRVAHRQHERYAAEAQQAQPAAPDAAAAPVATEPDYMAELAQLAQLREQGILTPEEFEAKKKQVLGL
jgi:hypothetical protein